jgi:RimJ/RimL family protein N-acetyltransferase
VSYSIRPLTPEDAEAYRELRLESLRQHPEAFASTYESAAQRPDSAWRTTLEQLTFFGAFAGDGRPVGLVAFDQSDGDKDKHRGWLLQMYVRPEMRGTGCAQALVETLLEQARGKVLQVHLGVWSENQPAIRLYEKTGFVTYATDPRAFYVNGRFIDDHLMVRFLDKAPGDYK